MVEHDIKRAAEAAKTPIPTEEELWQEVFRRNKAAYRPVVDLPAWQQLVLELADDGKTSKPRLAQDVAHKPSPDCPTPQNPATAINQYAGASSLELLRLRHWWFT